MAKKTSIAKSRVSAFHTDINKSIENFTGNHERNDVKAVPFDGNPIEIKKELLTKESNEKIIISNPPPAHILGETDEVKKFKKFISGKK